VRSEYLSLHEPKAASIHIRRPKLRLVVDCFQPVEKSPNCKRDLSRAFLGIYAQHRLLGEIYMGAAFLPGTLGPVISCHYPAFFFAAQRRSVERDKYRVRLSVQVCPNMQSQCGDLMPSGRSSDRQGKSAGHDQEE